MSLHINRFIDRVRAAESRQQREVTMTLTEARDLLADITRLLLKLESSAVTTAAAPEVVEVQLSGGTFR